MTDLTKVLRRTAMPTRDLTVRAANRIEQLERDMAVLEVERNEARRAHAEALQQVSRDSQSCVLAGETVRSATEKMENYREMANAWQTRAEAHRAAHELTTLELQSARRDATALAKDLNVAFGSSAIDAQEFPRIVRELRADRDAARNDFTRRIGSDEEFHALYQRAWNLAEVDGVGGSLTLLTGLAFDRMEAKLAEARRMLIAMTLLAQKRR